MMKKNWKIILLAILVVGTAGAIFAYRIYNKPHRNIESEKVDHTMEMSSLLTVFQTKEDSANRVYNSNVLEIKGRIDQKKIARDGKVVLLFQENNGMIKATMANDYFQEKEYIKAAEGLNAGTDVVLKCKCNGFDDLIEPTVELDNCFIVHK